MAKQSEYNKKETKKFIKLTKEALKNEEKKAEWNNIRAMYGIYPERDKGTYMLRPRFPAGLLNIEELEYFVNICEIYGEGRVHLTTRQDIQIHGLSIQNLIIVLELLLEKGYSSRSAGGHATRAIMTPPMSGFEEEIFDVTPYGDAITSFILENPDYMGLPRKYKIALSNNEKNSLTAKVSDLGLLAVEVNGIKGFKVDFMDRDDQTAVEMVERLAACTAKHHLILDLHGIYKPVGLNRTYPNIINYESVFGMEESRWTTIDHDMPLYDVTFPYIRMMAGQVDFTPGAMRNGTKNDWKANYIKPMSMGTRCHQAACYVVHDSPDRKSVV